MSNYSNVAKTLYIRSAIANNTTAITVTNTPGGAAVTPSTYGWPEHTFYAQINADTEFSEVVKVTSISGTSVTIERPTGQPWAYGSVAYAHVINSTIVPVFSADDIDNLIDKRSPIFVARIVAPASTSSAASFKIPPGAAPSVPEDGDIWSTGTGLFARINGLTKDISGNSQVSIDSIGNLVKSPTGATGFGAISGCTVGSSAQLFKQTATKTITGNGSASLTAGVTLTGATNLAPVVVGETYTAVVHVKAATVSHNGKAIIVWVQSNGTTQVSVSEGTAVNYTSGSWARLSVTDAAPTNAVYAAVQFKSDEVHASGEQTYIGGLGIWKGWGGQWAMPGTPIIGVFDPSVPFPTSAIADSSVTSAKIADGTIVDGDISSTAAIAQSKVANLTTDLGLKADKYAIGNLLTENQATAGRALGNTTGFRSGGGGLSFQYVIDDDGQGCVEWTAGVTSTSICQLAVNSNIFTSGMKVTPGEKVTAMVVAKTATTETTYLRVYWYKADGSASATAPTASTALAGNGSPQTHMRTMTVPPDAEYATLNHYRPSGAAGSTFKVKLAGFWRGTGGTWTRPGVPVIDLTDGAQEADAKAVTAQAAADALKAGVGNLLTANQAKPTAVGAWDFIQNATETAPGVYTASSTAGINAYSGATAALAVEEGATITAYVACSTVGRQNRARLRFYTAANAEVGTGVYGEYVAAGASGISMITTNVPATAVKVALYVVNSTSGTVGDTVTVTQAGVWRGARGIWQPPGRPIPGQSFVRLNSSYDMSGTGSPEGVVSAPVGSTYLQTDSVVDKSGVLVWRKVSGAGSTGWEPSADFDTGWIDFSGLLLNGWTVETTGAGCNVIRRKGSLVTVIASLATPPGYSASSTIFLGLPVGFRWPDAVLLGYNNGWGARDALTQIALLTVGPRYQGGVNSTGSTLYIVPADGTWTAGRPRLHMQFETDNRIVPTALPGPRI